MFIPNAAARNAISRPISPSPMMPIVLSFKLRVPAMRPQFPPGTCLRSNGLVRNFRSRKPLDAGQTVDAVDASREREHQRECMLRAGDIGAPAHSENLDAGSNAGRDIDISKEGAVLVNDLELRRASKLRRSHGEGFDDQGAGGRKLGAQLRRGGHETNLAGIEPSCARSEVIAPARKIRLVGRHEVGKSGASFLRRRGIKHHTDQASPGIVFNDHYRADSISSLHSLKRPAGQGAGRLGQVRSQRHPNRCFMGLAPWPGS